MAVAKRELIFLFLAILLFASRVTAQPAPPQSYQYQNFSPSMTIVIIVLISALFFMGFFSIYLRHCADMSSSTTVRNLGASLRRRTATQGLDRTILETFPVFGYSEVKDKKIGKGALECAVCLNEFEEEDTLRLIPKCDHVFHPECIDAWLESHVTCPVCRANLAEPGEVQNSEENPGEVSISIAEETSEPAVQEPVEPVPRSWSVRGKIWPKLPRSHTTGHSLAQPSLVQPGENVDRFTLRLPEEFRKKVMTRALNRTTSVLVLPTESSSKRAFRTGFGDSFKRADPIAKSDRWVFTMAPPFFSRGPSMRRGDEIDREGSIKSMKSPRVTMKLPSFKCLESRGDEMFLIQGESSTRPSV